MNLEDLGRRGWVVLRRHLLDALDERGLVAGTRVEFPSPGECSLRRFEVAGPGPGELLIETLATIISPGTERAVYQRAETIAVEYPFAPGYCHAGRVLVAGYGSACQPGELVATSSSHASLALVASARALPIPNGVRPEHAAMAQLGFTALQGVRKARIRPGETVLVIGCGIVGQLAAQLARLAGGNVVVAATSPERMAVARSCGFERLLNTRSARGELEQLAADVVIEASGNPQAILDAAGGARTGARVVLLGSSRGTTRNIDLEAWQRKMLTLVGAHVWTAPTSDSSPGAWTWREECEAFLGLLAQRRIDVEPLITYRAAPDEAPRIYEDLTGAGDRSVAIAFDWTRQGPWRPRVERPSPLRGLGRLGRALLRRPPLPSTVAPMPRPDGRVLRFGLIGCGEIAIENAAALRAAQNTTITFAVDLDIEAARGLAAATGAQFSNQLDQLLASTVVDAVVISVPHHLHATLAIAAAKAGKHVVVEKPMATTVADSDRMIQAASENGVVLSVCYCQRFDPRILRARNLIEAGALGTPLGSRIVFGQFRGAEYWTKGLTGRTTSDWRARRETAGGGVLIMNACHLLDGVSWLVGSEIREVQACVATLRHEVEVEDSISMSYRYASGALGSLEATTTLVGPPVYEQAIRGSKGQMMVTPELRFWSKETIQGYEAGRWHTLNAPPSGTERRQFFEGFANAVLDGTPPPVTAQEARAVQAAIGAAYEAAESAVTLVKEPSR